MLNTILVHILYITICESCLSCVSLHLPHSVGISPVLILVIVDVVGLLLLCLWFCMFLLSSLFVYSHWKLYDSYLPFLKILIAQNTSLNVNTRAYFIDVHCAILANCNRNHLS